MCALGYSDPLCPGSKDTQHEGNALGITQRVGDEAIFSGSSCALLGCVQMLVVWADKSMCGEKYVYFPRGPFISMLFGKGEWS